MYFLVLPFRSLHSPGSLAWLPVAGSSAPAHAVSGQHASPSSAEAAGPRP